MGEFYHQNQHNVGIKDRDQYARSMVEERQPDFEYVGGYTNSDGYVSLKCKACGTVFDRTFQSVRKRVQIKCDTCYALKKEKEIQAINKARLEKKLQRQSEIDTYLFLHTYQVECVECGKVFSTRRSNQICCSEECGKKHNNRTSSKRKDKRIAKDKRIDRDITAKKLYARDRGICWICGGQCDLNDFTIRDGIIICGNNYPSVDHVVAVCDGGEDSWSNVRLAHRICNSKRFFEKNFTPPFKILKCAP